MYLSPEGMKQIEEALDAEPQVIPELVDAIRKSRQQFGRIRSSSQSIHQ